MLSLKMACGLIPRKGLLFGKKGKKISAEFQRLFFYLSLFIKHVFSSHW